LEAVWEYSRSSWNMMEGGDWVAFGYPARSGVFYTLLVYVSSWIILVIIDTLILFLLFSGINPTKL
jgi:hypothetical protein